VKRLRAQLDGRERVHHALGESHPSMLLVDEPDLREALDELVQLRAERVQDTRAVIDIVRSIERGLLGNISPADELRNHFGNRDARLAPQPTKREGGD
jgi:long-subunit acyl-CoA synthetase (AMP-forming)